MVNVTLGKTGIKVNKNGFGALPIQRISAKEAAYLLKKARNAGINYFDTARAYTDSEEKIGLAFCGNWDGIFVATKSGAQNGSDMRKDLETSLRNLKTDCIDIYQFHNPAFCPKPGDGSGLYEAALKAKEEGLIRHIGITNHRLNVALEAISSGLYETLQFPFSYVSGQQDIDLVNKCREAGVGFIAMKGLSGGLLTDYRACYAFEAQFDNVLPIWGIQRECELDQWISCIENPPQMTDMMKKIIEQDRKNLSGSFCRGCGYCMPCTAGIEINQCARMSQLIRRAPSGPYLTQEWQGKMAKIKECLNCRICTTRCPYSLDIPTLLKKNLEDYESITSGKTTI